MFESVLVANRGEIARRVLRACRALGARGVAVYSEADAGWPHVGDADEAVLIGPAPSRESYLQIERILEAARATRAEAIHPGYGFLSENWQFARACEEAGLVFIGPPWAVIRQMGEKVAARRLMASAGVPVVPGSDATVKDVDEAQGAARSIGYPVMLKVSGGGGGIGMARANDAGQLAQAFPTAQRRAQAAFGVADLYLERYLEEARHVEVQVFGDRAGAVVHLHERECSIQRRHQKLVEESPAPRLGPDLKLWLTGSAVRGARAVGYLNAGTMEFLVDRAGGEGIRVECGVAVGLAVSVHYDPLLAKLIARGQDREEALARMRQALAEFSVEGVKTTLPFLRAVVASERFARGQVHTQMVEQGAFNA